MTTTTISIAIAPCPSHRHHPRRRRARLTRARTRTSHTSGIQAEEQTDTMFVNETSINGTGATVMNGIIFKAGEKIGAGERVPDRPIRLRRHWSRVQRDVDAPGVQELCGLS
eukprot:8657542-Pyramimonas_sp.AAC.1